MVEVRISGIGKSLVVVVVRKLRLNTPCATQEKLGYPALAKVLLPKRSSSATKRWPSDLTSVYEVPVSKVYPG